MSSPRLSPPPRLPLSDDDVRGVVRLLGEVAGMGTPLRERRRALVAGLAGLVGADVWCWVVSRGVLNGRPAALALVDGGFADEAEQTRFWRISGDPEFTGPMSALIDPDALATVVANGTEPPWDTHPTFARFVRPSGFEHLLFSFYPLGDGAMSALGLHRRAGRPPFAPRERALVHLVAGQLDWLHRAGTDVPANGPALEALSPRLREALLYMLCGDSRKQVARRMGVTGNTVGGYCKQLHAHFGVKSRGELLALFVGTGRGDARGATHA